MWVTDLMLPYRKQTVTLQTYFFKVLNFTVKERMNNVHKKKFITEFEMFFVQKILG